MESENYKEIKRKQRIKRKELETVMKRKYVKMVFNTSAI